MEKETNNEELVSIVKNLFKYIPIETEDYQGFYDYENGILYKETIVKKKVKNDILEKKAFYPERIIISDSMIISNISGELFAENVEAVVSNYKISASIFKYSERKKSAVGKKVKMDSVDINKKYKSSKKKLNTIVIIHNDKKLRFLFEDIDFIYPNFKSFVAPKDRTIIKGVNVRTIKDIKEINVSKNKTFEVLETKTVGKNNYSLILTEKNTKKFVNNKLLKKI